MWVLVVSLTATANAALPRVPTHADGAVCHVNYPGHPMESFTNIPDFICVSLLKHAGDESN
jgi:hypothetical protein